MNGYEINKICKRWTPEEDKILREFYPVGGSKECHNKLSYRTIQAIQQRAYKEGIKGNKNQNFKDLTGRRFNRGIVLNYNQEISKRMNISYWDLICDCGNIYTARRDNLKSQDTQSCGCLHNEKASQRCSRRVGKIHPNWKGGITKLPNKIRTHKKYSMWRDLVFERDNYTCQYSGERGGFLNIHHIKPLYLILIERNIRTIKEALNCKEIWDISNVVTLSEKWHLGIRTFNLLALHKIYRGSVYVEQNYYTWLKERNYLCG